MILNSGSTVAVFAELEVSPFLQACLSSTILSIPLETCYPVQENLDGSQTGTARVHQHCPLAISNFVALASWWIAVWEAFLHRFCEGLPLSLSLATLQKGWMGKNSEEKASKGR